MANIAPTLNGVTVLAATTPSTSFGSPTLSDSFATGQVNQIAAYISFTKGSLTSIDIIPQFSYDGSTWFSKPLLNFSAGTSDGNNVYTVPTYPASVHLTNSMNITLDLPSGYAYARFKVYATGTTTSSSISIFAGSGQI